MFGVSFTGYSISFESVTKMCSFFHSQNRWLQELSGGRSVSDFFQFYIHSEMIWILQLVAVLEKCFHQEMQQRFHWIGNLNLVILSSSFYCCQQKEKVVIYWLQWLLRITKEKLCHCYKMGSGRTRDGTQIFFFRCLLVLSFPIPSVIGKL